MATSRAVLNAYCLRVQRLAAGDDAGAVRACKGFVAKRVTSFPFEHRDESSSADAT